MEGKYASLIDVMVDPESTTRHLVDYAGAAEDALARCNDDKRAIKNLTKESP